jgi:putative zinc finger protein
MTNSNMTCEAFDAALPDYLEGTLDDSLRASVELHLRECVRCTSLVRDIENIRHDAAALPELVPARDLWDGIEARIAAPVIPLAAHSERQRRFAPAWMGVAAAALIVSTAGITYMLTARSFSSRPDATVAQTSPIAGQQQSTVDASSAQQQRENSLAAAPGQIEGGSASPALAGSTPAPRAGARTRLASQDIQSGSSRSEVAYGDVIEKLQLIVSQRRTQLDSSTVAIIEKNLQIIDAAIAQSREALAKDPASLLLSEQLTHALDKKVELLRTAALLPAST